LDIGILFKYKFYRLPPPPDERPPPPPTLPLPPPIDPDDRVEEEGLETLVGDEERVDEDRVVDEELDGVFLVVGLTVPSERVDELVALRLVELKS